MKGDNATGDSRFYYCFHSAAPAAVRHAAGICRGPRRRLQARRARKPADRGARVARRGRDVGRHPNRRPGAAVARHQLSRRVCARRRHRRASLPGVQRLRLLDRVARRGLDVVAARRGEPAARHALRVDVAHGAGLVGQRPQDATRRRGRTTRPTRTASATAVSLDANVTASARCSSAWTAARRRRSRCSSARAATTAGSTTRSRRATTAATPGCRAAAADGRRDVRGQHRPRPSQPAGRGAARHDRGPLSRVPGRGNSERVVARHGGGQRSGVAPRRGRRRPAT